jgi:eukaryotic-like serine/threonine-protein kinase
VAVVKGAIWVAEWDLPGYTELKALGSGGSGDVVLARHDASGTLVAIKYLHRKLLADPQWVESFRAEAQVLAALDDPNIVRLYEYAESPSGAAIVMELVDGVSVREILRHQGGTTPEAALVVLRGSLLGLAAAHRRSIVHRDYKPENVLVDGNGNSKLTDFGIAARTGQETLPTGTVMYAPPEQFAGAPASPVGDVYAATATFYECLTGRPPFVGDTAERLLYQHMAEPVPLEPVPEPLRSLVAVGMAKEPWNRPADATTFVAALDTVASGAYGPDWAKRGRSHLGEVALLLAALWPSAAPPAVQGSAVEKVNMSHGSQDAQESRHLLHLRHLRHVRHVRHLEHLRHRRLSPVGAALGAAAAVALLTTGAALAVGGNTSANLSASIHPTTVQQVALQPLVASASHPASGSSSPSVAAGIHSSSSGSSSSGSSSGPSSSSSSPSAKASSSAKASASSSPKASPSASASSSSPPAPALTGVSPASGPTGGGTSVTITGAGLAGAKGVTFGGAAAAITADSATQITVTSPPGSAGTVDVIVVTPGGTTAGQFSYVAPPALTGISPTCGSTDGKTLVTLTGTNLAGATGVSFGSAAGAISTDTATQITVFSPPGKAGTVSVTATSPAGTSNAEEFTYSCPIQ